MPFERNSSARVISQEDELLQVEHDGATLTVSMKGFPPGFKLQKGSRVILCDEPAGTVARPLVRVSVTRVSPNAVLKGGELQVEGRRVQMQTATVHDRRLSEAERERGDQYSIWTVEGSGKERAEQQVIAVRKAR